MDMADPMMPDLSGLSEEERKILEEVFARQRAEEQKDEQLTQTADRELEDIERQLQQRKEASQRLIGTQDDAICQICQITKFVDGIGHKCFYCQLRSCARCGGRTTSKNKNIWACSLCQKRQQILAKTGKWFQNPDQRNLDSRPNSQHDLASQTNGGGPSPSGNTPNGQPPIHSYPSNQGLATHTMNGSLPQQQPQQSVQMPPPTQPQQQPPPTQKESVVGGIMGMIGLKPSTNNVAPQKVVQQPAQPIPPQNGQQQQLPPSNVPRRQNTLHRQPSLNDRDYDRRQSQSARYEQDHYREAETSKRAYEDERRRRSHNGDAYTESPRGSRDSYYDERGRNGQREGRRRENGQQQIYDDDPSFRREGRRSTREYDRPPHIDRRSPDPGRRGASGSGGGAQARKQQRPVRTDSQTHRDPPPACPPAVPPPEKPIGFSTPTTLKPLPSMQTRHRKSRLQNRSSMKEGTSSEEETPQGNTESSEKNDVTEKDLLLYIYGGHKAKMGPEMAKFDMSLKSKSNLDLATSSRGSVLPGNTLAAKIRRYLSSPVSWQPTADQKHLVGHMVLQRLKNDNGDLGLKVVGGRATAPGRLGAFITKVRPGSVADIVGQLKPGDEVLEWNTYNLQNATAEHVRQIVCASKNDTHVELIVSRNLALAGTDDFLNIRRSATGLGDYVDFSLHRGSVPDTIDPMTGLRRPVAASLSPNQYPPGTATPTGTFQLPRVRHASIGPRPFGGVAEAPFSLSQQLAASGTRQSPLIMAGVPNSALLTHPQQPAIGGQAQIFGRIEISLLYLPHERELVVTVLGAMDLPPRRDGAYRNPYAKLFLLPDRSEKSIRQTAILADTLAPSWNESFYYRNLAEPVLMSRVLEVTVWDYDKYETNTFLGEVLIDFSTAVLDNQPFSYTLVEMDDDNPVRLRLRNRRFSSATPPPRPYSEMANYHGYNGMFRNQRNHMDPFHHRDDYETGEECGYGPDGEPLPPGMSRSRTYDRSGTTVPTGGVANTACAYGPDWTVYSQQPTSNGYSSDYGFSQQMSSRYSTRRPHSATLLRAEGDMSPHTAPRFRSRPRTRHSHDPGFRHMSPLNSPYGPEEPPPPPRHEVQPNGRRYHHQHQHHPEGVPGPMDMSAPNNPQASQLQQAPNLPSHLQPGMNNGEYGSDGSETMSINSAQSMQNRQMRQQLPASSEDGECSSNSLRHQNYVNDEFGQSASMEEGGQSDSTMKANNQSLKEMKERKKSLMTRLIPGRAVGGLMENKRTGFARSEEVGVPGNLAIPTDRLGAVGNFQKQASKESTDSDNWQQGGAAFGDGFGMFVENLGPGQVVGRQVLASPVLGELELSIRLAPTGIQVTVLRGKNLSVRPNIKVTPAPYVKVYLMEGKVCHCKAKTFTADRKSTAPMFNQTIDFPNEPFKHRVLQVTVLGDCGRMERKLFMGIAQIKLDDLATLGQPVQSWYKLFHHSSLTGVAPIRKDSESSLVSGQQ